MFNASFSRNFILPIALLLCFHSSIAQDTLRPKFLQHSPEYNRKRVVFLTTGYLSVYSGTMIGLYSLWYKNYPLTGFHFFNDNREWSQMDKIGHAYSANVAGRAGVEVIRWAGVSNKKAVWIGGSFGFVFLTTIEILDAFSEKWGASTGDLIANTAGALLVIGQEFAWNEQRMIMKFAFHKVDYSGYSLAHQQRAKELYGKSWNELFLKDYNGQTYWLSCNIASFLRKESKFPKWLNLAGGYGAENLFCGHEEDCKGEPWEYPKRYRQYYLSVDVDLLRIKTKSRLLRMALVFLNSFKIPAPTLELNEYGELKFHPFYF